MKYFLLLLLIPSLVLAQDPPELANYEAQMRTYGLRHCAFLKDTNVAFDPHLAATYYDAEFVFYQVAEYLKDSSWESCALAAGKIYRDQYVVPNNGQVPGYWIFGHGLLKDFEKTQNPLSKSALVQLANNAAYAPDSTPAAWTVDSTMSREVAYNIMSYLNAEKVGRVKTPRYSLLVNQALGHIDQWFASKTAPYIRPFMVAITAHALISHNAKTPDNRVLPALKLSADYMWANLWIPASKAFKYTDRIVDPGDTNPAPDLNLLIAPLYAWLYKETGEIKYKSQADQIFAGGVTQAYLVNPKQYNQNYRWSFDYLKWRSAVNPCEVNPTPATQECVVYYLRNIRDLLK